MDNTYHYIITTLIEKSDDELFWWIEKGLYVDSDKIFMNEEELMPNYFINDIKKVKKLKEKIIFLNRIKSLNNLYEGNNKKQGTKIRYT